MGIEIPSTQKVEVVCIGLFGAACHHNSGAFERIACLPLIQHQRDAAVGKNIFGMHRQARN